MRTSRLRKNRPVFLVSVICLVLTCLAAFPSAANGMYDARHGRWLQRDPLGVRPDASSTQTRPHRQYADGANLYDYVGGEPTDVLDPFGNAGIDREWPKEVERGLSADDLRKLEKKTKDKAMKKKIRKARKMVEEAERLAEKTKGNRRRVRRGGGGAIFGAILVILMNPSEASAPELPWQPPTNPAECGQCECRKVLWIYYYDGAASHDPAGIVPGYNPGDESVVYEGRTTYKDCMSHEQDEDHSEFDDLGIGFRMTYRAMAIRCGFETDEGHVWPYP